MRPARRVRRALPLPNSVRVSASRRKSTTVVCSLEGGSACVPATGRGTPHRGTRTSITEYGGPSPSPGNTARVLGSAERARTGPEAGTGRTHAAVVRSGAAGSPTCGGKGSAHQGHGTWPAVVV